MKISTLLSFVAIATSAFAANPYWETPGTGKAYTFNSLSTIEESGVVKEGNAYTITKDLHINAKDSLILDNKATLKLDSIVVIEINGYGNFAPADTAVITSSKPGNKAKGIYFKTKETSYGPVKNVTFQYVCLRYAGIQPLEAENCTWEYAYGNLGTTSNGAALSFFTTAGVSTVKNCRFLSNQGPAIANGVGVVSSMHIEGCYFYDNNTDNRNKPQINLNPVNDGVIEVVNNTLVGNRRDKVGGIAVSNSLNSAGTYTTLIEGNDIRNHRYGITTMGRQNVVIKNNTLVDNNAETVPANGGSGINITDSKCYQNCVITGNHIEGHLWGISIIGGMNVNVGKTEDKNAADYNPGGNTFKNNGNNGQLYDLYNNSANDVYAQGNTWNVSAATAEEIAKVIYDKADDPTLGTVIYMPAAGATGVSAATAASGMSYSKATSTLQLAAAANVDVYAITGAKVASAAAVTSLDLSALAPGIYIAKTATATIKFIK